MWAHWPETSGQTIQAIHWIHAPLFPWPTEVSQGMEESDRTTVLETGMRARRPLGMPAQHRSPAIPPMSSEHRRLVSRSLGRQRP